MIRAALVSAVLAFSASAASGDALLRELPPLLQAVSDEVGVMTLSEGRALAKHIARVEDERGIRTIVVVAETVRPESIDEYTRRLLARWRAGSTALDGGRYVLIVLAVKDRELRLTPGSVTEDLVEKLERGAALDALPGLLRQGRYYEALDAIVRHIERLSLSREPAA